MALNMSQVEALGRQLKSSGSTLKRETHKTVKSAAERVRDGAKERAPVGPTGDLRDEIYAASEGNVGQVIAPTRYAIFNEYGTSKMDPQPFMTPALEAEEPNFLTKARETAEAAIAKAIG